MVGASSLGEGLAGLSAVRVALRRAAHQLVDAPVVFRDPFAVRLLGADHAAALARTPVQRRIGRDRSWSRSLRAFAVARSLYAEEQLAGAAARGLRQYVVLGAGLDTFAWRNPFAELRVWEVDRPGVQGWKRELAQRAGMAEPERCVRVAADLGGDKLEARLRGAGLVKEEPVLFALLGVAPYLEPAKCRRLLAMAHSQSSGSGIVFDYRVPATSLGEEEQRQHASHAARLSAAGEPLCTAWTRAEMAAELGGFDRVEDLGADELNLRYFSDRDDGLAVRGEAVRMAGAWMGR